MRTSERGTQIRSNHFRYFRPFISRCGISWTSLDRMSNFSTSLDRSCQVQSTAAISIHFAGLMLGAESGGNEQSAREEESDNLFSRVSRRCCSYAASFFVYHVRTRGGLLPSSRTVGSNKISQTRRGNRIHVEASKPIERRCILAPFASRDDTFPRSICREGESILPRHNVSSRTSRWQTNCKLSVANRIFKRVRLQYFDPISCTILLNRVILSLFKERYSLFTLLFVIHISKLYSVQLYFYSELIFLNLYRIQKFVTYVTFTVIFLYAIFFENKTPERTILLRDLKFCWIQI